MKTLLLEANPSRTELLCEALARRGHEVTHVDDADAALAALERDGYPLVFVGVESVDEVGVDLCRQLRTVPRDVPGVVIAVTGRDDPDDLEALLAAGADDYLVLPGDSGLLGPRLVAFARRADAACRANIAEPVALGGSGDPVGQAAADKLAGGGTRFRAIFEDAALGIVLADLEGRIIECNPQFAQMLGYTVAELIGTHIAEISHPDDWAAERPHFLETRTNARKTGQREKRYFRKDGSTVWGRLSGSVIGDAEGTPLFTMGVIENITRRKEAEAALRESELKLRTLIENIPDTVLVTDHQAVIQFINHSTPTATVEELLGRSGFDFIAPEHRETCRRRFQEAIDTQQAQTLDIRAVRGLWWALRIVPLVEHGRVERLMTICTDVTEQRRAEEAVGREQELLRQLLDLHERDRELLAFELHDGFAQQLAGAKMNFEAAAQVQQTNPEQARASYQHGIRLLRESIEESRRLISGLRPPVLDEFGIVAAVEHVVAESQAMGNQQIEFVSRGTFRRMPRPLESALFRTVRESLNNARCHSQSAKVRVELWCQGDHVSVAVQDWGVGFDPHNVHERCFGLRGIRERARLLKGQAEIQTALGKGTRVLVKLPLVERREGAAR